MAQTIKLLTLGKSNVGKTSIINRYVNHDFIENHPPTIAKEKKKRSIKYNKTKDIIVELTSTAGYGLFSEIEISLIRETDGIIYVYDITDKDSFNSLLNKIQDIKKKFNIFNNSIPSILIGNKVDLEVRKVNFEEGEELAQENEIDFYETSAKEDINIETSIYSLIEKVILKTQEEEDSRSEKGSIKITKDKKCKNNCTC